MTDNKIHVAYGFHVNCYHSYRGDTNDNLGFGSDIRIIRKILDVLTEFNKKGIPVKALDNVTLTFPEKGMVFLLGKSGSGKSTLLNALTGSDIPANNRLFDTLDTTTRTLEISDTCTALISDTVGFISKLPHQLVDAFKATLEELTFADLLLHVIDASDPNWREQAEVVDHLILELGASETPRLEVFNKCDLFPSDILPRGEDMVSISARTGEGLKELLEAIEKHLDAGTQRVVIHLPYDKGGILDTLYRDSKVEKVEYSETIDVTAVCTVKTIGQLKDYVEGYTPQKEDWE